MKTSFGSKLRRFATLHHNKSKHGKDKIDIPQQSMILDDLSQGAVYLSVGHPPYYKGLDYIYENRGEVLDMRIFETGEYALIGWVGIPTAPAWLPTYMIIKVPKHMKQPVYVYYQLDNFY